MQCQPKRKINEKICAGEKEVFTKTDKLCIYTFIFAYSKRAQRRRKQGKMRINL